MFLQYTKYRDIDAVTWHDACHVTKSPRLSLRFSLGRVKGQSGIIARKEGEPGNEATSNLRLWLMLYTLLSLMCSLSF